MDGRDHADHRRQVFPANLPRATHRVDVFLLCVAIAVSLLQGGRVQEKAVNVGRVDFSTRPSFNLAAAIIAAILIALYWYWW